MCGNVTISPQETNPSFNQLTSGIHQHSGALATTPDKTSVAHLYHLCMQATTAKAGERIYKAIPSPVPLVCSC